MHCRSRGGGGVLQATPRGKLKGLTRGRFSRPTPVGVSRPTPRGVSRPTPGGGCIPACSEADPPWTATAMGSTHPTGMHSCS